MLVGPCILANACDLPRDFDIGGIRLDRKPIAFYLLGDDRLCEGSDDSELITEVPVQRLEVSRQFDNGVAAFISHDVAIVDIFHVG